MKIAEINETSIKEASNKELSNLHYRIHQLYGHREKKRINVEMLKDAHNIVVSEMKNRGMKPKCKGLNFMMKKVAYYMEGLDDDE